MRLRAAVAATPVRMTAIAVTGASLVVATGMGVFASLNAQAYNPTPQAVSTGTLKLELAAGQFGSTPSAGFSQIVAPMAPGDTITRFVDVANTGSIVGSSLTLAITDTVTAATLNDSVKGLQVTVQSCAAGWSASGTCAFPVTEAASAPVGSYGTRTLSSSGLGAGTGVLHLMVQLVLPDQTETTVNGVLPSTTVQGQNAALTYTFTETQRPATNTTA